MVRGVVPNELEQPRQLALRRARRLSRRTKVALYDRSPSTPVGRRDPGNHSGARMLEGAGEHASYGVYSLEDLASPRCSVVEITATGDPHSWIAIRSMSITLVIETRRETVPGSRIYGNGQLAAG
jgi:hypothetical protein